MQDLADPHKPAETLRANPRKALPTHLNPHAETEIETGTTRMRVEIYRGRDSGA